MRLARELVVSRAAGSRRATTPRPRTRCHGAGCWSAGNNLACQRLPTPTVPSVRSGRSHTNIPISWPSLRGWVRSYRLRDRRAEEGRRSSVQSPPSPLPDIDGADRSDPLAATEYVHDIFSYFKRVQDRYSVAPDYMAGQADINEKVRAFRRRGAARVASRSTHRPYRDDLHPDPDRATPPPADARHPDRLACRGAPQVQAHARDALPHRQRDRPLPLQEAGHEKEPAARRRHSYADRFQGAPLLIPYLPHHLPLSPSPPSPRCSPPRRARPASVRPSAVRRDLGPRGARLRLHFGPRLHEGADPPDGEAHAQRALLPPHRPHHLPLPPALPQGEYRGRSLSSSADPRTASPGPHRARPPPSCPARAGARAPSDHGTSAA